MGKHIDKILRDIGLQPTKHEPCLYAGTIDGNRILFLRQVDDFAVAAKDEHSANQLIKLINSKMRIDMKALGIINRFNGIDIHQTRNYIKITCEKYIHKMLKQHNWLDTSTMATKPTPLPSDHA
jgi:hypothetical protein